MSERASWDQEPVFRNSPGKDLRSKKEDIHETNPPDLGDIRKTQEFTKNEERDLALARLQTASTEEQVNEIIDEYNAKLEPSDFSQASIMTQVGELKINGKEFIVEESYGGGKGLLAREKEPFPSEAQIKSAWKAIGTDRQLAGILAGIMKGDLTKRNSLTEQDVRDFYKDYDSIDAYMKSGVITKFLEALQATNTHQKLREYNLKALEFSDTMFPGQ